MKSAGRWFDVVTFRRTRPTDWMIPAAVAMGIGVVAGVGIGMLFAPQSGEEARLKLRAGAARVKEKAADLAERARNQVSSASNELRPIQS